MRLHTDTLTMTDIYAAAREARVDVEVTSHGSRKRDHAFNVNLTGESRRRPNRGSSTEYAATWDQWGVFFAVLFDRDQSLCMPPYADVDEFNYRTGGRFMREGMATPGRVMNRWPADAHGDHRFEFEGTPFEQTCSKCSAVTRWAPR